MKRSLYTFLFALCAALCLLVPAGALLAAPNEGFTFTDEDVKDDMKLESEEEQQPKIYSLEDVKIKIFSYAQRRQEILNALKNDGRDNSSEVPEAYKREVEFFQKTFVTPWRSKQVQFSGSAGNKALAQQLFEEIIACRSESYRVINLLAAMMVEGIFEKNASMTQNVRFLNKIAPQIEEEAKAFYTAMLNALRIMTEMPLTPASKIYSFSGLDRFITHSGQLGIKSNIFSVLDFHSREIGDNELDKRIKACGEIIGRELNQAEAGCAASAERLRALKAGKDVENLIAADLKILNAAENWLKETKKLAENLKDWNTREGGLLHYNVSSSSESFWYKGKVCPKGTDYVGSIKQNSNSLLDTIKQLQKK